MLDIANWYFLRLF